MYTYCLILQWDSFKQGQWVFTSYIENNERLLHILYVLVLFFLCINSKKKFLKKKVFEVGLFRWDNSVHNHQSINPDFEN